LAIKQRLDELGLEQRELARAANVTESYISQLLTRRRAPPAPSRTDIYEKMDKVLQLPQGELAKLAAHQRTAQIKRELGDEPEALFPEVRALILKKCGAAAPAVQGVFEKSPFGELERLVARTLLELLKGITRTRIDDDAWTRGVAKAGGRTAAELRAIAGGFLEMDILNLSADTSVAFLDPLIASWDIDLPTFEIEVHLDPRFSPDAPVRRFQYVERLVSTEAEPGFAEFLKDKALSGSATAKELEFLGGLRFTTGQPTALYYYRELQSLRDPLHFRRDITA
jgi:transcriptional regulator with XRE-family HTH domain